MQIQLRSFVNSVATSFNERIVPSLSAQQKKIAIIATVALGILAAILIYYFNQPKKPSVIIVEEKPKTKEPSLKKREDDTYKKKTITLDDGTKEEGYFKDGKLHGYGGTRTYPDGKVESGTFEEGVLQGDLGRVKYPDGKEESGKYVEGKLHGSLGRVKYPDGKEESGNYVDGKLQGSAIVKFADGKLGITGEFQNGELIHGYDHTNGAMKQGDFKGGMLHGKGKKIEGGVTEEGDFKEGKLHGTGMRHSVEEDLEGEFIEGTFIRGTKTCRTFYISKIQNTIWQGEFEHDQLVKGKKTVEKSHVPGEVKNETPDLLDEGEFINELLDGQGKRTLASGEVQNGEFTQGFLFKGRRTLTDGTEEDGSFTYGSFVQGKKTLPGGIIEDGEFKNGVFVKGTRTLTEGTIQKGTFKHGLLHGPGGTSRFEDDENIYESKGEWKRGKLILGREECYTKAYLDLPDVQKVYALNGPGKRTWRDGSEEEGEFKDNKLNGQGKKTKSGRVDEGEFKDNKLNGKGTRTFDGTVEEGDFENGKLINGKRTIIKGNLKTVDEGEFNANNMLREGTRRRYSIGPEELKNTYEGTFENGHLIEGKKNINGTISEGTFKEDELIKGTITYADGSSQEIIDEED